MGLFCAMEKISGNTNSEGRTRVAPDKDDEGISQVRRNNTKNNANNGTTTTTTVEYNKADCSIRERYSQLKAEDFNNELGGEDEPIMNVRRSTTRNASLETSLQPQQQRINGTGSMFAPNPSSSMSEVYGSILSECGQINGSPKCCDNDNVMKSLGAFSRRAGKTLSWRNVNMTLTSSDKTSGKERKILDDVWGQVPRKEVTALMGPSGAGKSTLLEILAGRVTSRGRVRVEQKIYLNKTAVNLKRSKVRKSIAFVAQDDSLQVTSTPREAIRFSAKLRLPKTTPEDTLDKLTSQILAELGLKKCADTMIGGPLIKGISGGERKRTSVGVELVVKPSMVFLDEPTSGLDSFSAIQLCQVLKKVAMAGASVLLTIHQPASEIFTSFDHLILLNKGRVMYQGSVSNVPTFFEERGYPVPKNFNPADWIMSVAQAIPVDQLAMKGFFQKKNIGLIEFDIEESSEPNELDSVMESTGGGDTVSTFVQVYLLLQREARYMYRDTKQVLSRAGLSICMSLLIGAVYFDIGSVDLNDPISLQNLFGALTLLLTQAIMGSALPAVLTFPVERPVFLREYSTNHYSVLSYFVSRLVVEALITLVQTLVSCIIMYFMMGPRTDFGIVLGVSYALGMTSTAMAVILGSSIEDPKLGTELMPVVFVPQFLLSGFFVIPSLIPVWLRWIRFIWPMKYSVDVLAMEEFGVHDCGGMFANTLCDGLLDSLEITYCNQWRSWLILVAMFIIFRMVALEILRRKAQKFL